jgi:hypothetical protein
MTRYFPSSPAVLGSGCPGAGKGRNRIAVAVWKNAFLNSGETAAGVIVDDICEFDVEVPLNVI